jgi:hypothetical protein
MKRFLLLSVLLVASVAAARALLLPRPKPRPLRFAAWYWHQPFRLDPGDAETLERAGFGRFYVLAATLTSREGALRFENRQRWETTALPGELWATVRVHPSAHASLLGPGGEDALADLLPALNLVAPVKGLQLDADIPTAQLPQYAAFLSGLRRRLPAGWQLSVTALPDWLGTRGYRQVCGAVDEVVPQLYGNYWPEAGKTPRSLWETRTLIDNVRIAAAGGGRARVWIGLPAYGRCFVLNSDWSAAGVRHDQDPVELVRDGGWETAGSGAYSASLFNRGTVTEHWLHHKRDEEGARSLFFQWPRVSGLSAAVGVIRSLKLPAVEGVSLFRLAAPGEPLGFPARSLAAAVRGGAAGDASLRLERSGPSLTVSVENEGVETLCDLQVGVETEGGTIEAEGPVAWRAGGAPASPLRADRAALTRPLLRPGETWEVCNVRGSRWVGAGLRWRRGDGTWWTVRDEERLP